MTGPGDLVIIIGRPAAELAHLPATERVSAIAATPRVNGTTTLYKYGFGMVAVGLVFPLLTLIGTATRLAAARREERFAAFRLVGATPRQVGVIASVEAFMGAAIGTLAGIAIFQPLQPVVARVAVTGSRYCNGYGYPRWVPAGRPLHLLPARSGSCRWRWDWWYSPWPRSCLPGTSGRARWAWQAPGRARSCSP